MDNDTPIAENPTEKTPPPMPTIAPSTIQGHKRSRSEVSDKGPVTIGKVELLKKFKVVEVEMKKLAEMMKVVKAKPKLLSPGKQSLRTRTAWRAKMKAIDPNVTFLDGKHTSKYPFLPWLHFTEACKHCFREARRIVKDFTYHDFIYMMPKLHARIRYTMRHFKINPKATAIGYVHTYLDSAKLNVINLATYSSHSEMEALDRQVLAETESLLHLLGISASRLRDLEHEPNNVIPTLPSFTPLLRYNEHYPVHPDSDVNSDKSAASSVYSEDEELTACEWLQLLHEDDDIECFTNRTVKELSALPCAAIALDADEFMEL
ncbi:hypothetical protein DFP72DRAFT_1071279 [Ephemerocybe angulata]|uniref:Uncharacterized protein n=1 Tax=Ephemerocybe angulata TaxID=980116 RepID=A0A8H6M234_9AGAR|nr:hypothetical protein DFP72DRAFT_1071279 [Tulosesus angulatus]